MPQTIVITGASDGIGAAAARQLQARDHDVVLVGRSPAKTQTVAHELGAPFHVADFAKLDDVRRLAGELEHLARIDVLVNNAGGIMGKRQLTQDGFERTFQVNHLAPFLLTQLLLKRLIASRGKVIQTASAAANFYGSGFDIDDLNNEHNYSPEKAYGYAKLENVLFTRELDRRYRADGIAAVAFHPGVVRSNFASDTTHVMRFVYHTPVKYLTTISPGKSAQRLTRLVEGQPGVDWEPGEFYAKDNPVKLRFQDDGTVARKLWTRSEELLATTVANPLDD
jgi:NAD(P)-dependent dehydrogenase (short-subunit alcohol dehydrogenase family)